MTNRTRDAYRNAFDGPAGEIILADLERIADRIKLDRVPTDSQSNPAFMNANAAIYQSAVRDVIKRIRMMLKGEQFYESE